MAGGGEFVREMGDMAKCLLLFFRLEAFKSENHTYQPVIHMIQPSASQICHLHHWIFAL